MLRALPLFTAIGLFCSCRAVHAAPCVFLDTGAGAARTTQLIYIDHGATLLSLSDDLCLRSWNPQSGKEENAFRLSLDPKLSDDSVGAGGSAVARVSQDGGVAAVSGANGKISLVQLDSSVAPRVAILSHRSSAAVVYLCFSGDGHWLAAARIDKSIDIWDLRSFKRTTFTTSGVATDLAFASDGDAIAAAVNDGSIRIWWTRSSREVTLSPPDHNVFAKCVAWSPGGTVIAAGFADRGGRPGGDIQLWDADSLSPIAHLHKLEAPVEALAFTHDGQRLSSTIAPVNDAAAVKARKSPYCVRLLDWQNDSTIAEYHCDGASAPVAALSRDSADIAISDGKQNDIILWNPVTGAAPRRLLSGAAAASDIAWSRDGALLRWKVTEERIRPLETASGAAEHTGAPAPAPTAANTPAANSAPRLAPETVTAWALYDPERASGDSLAKKGFGADAWETPHKAPTLPGAALPRTTLAPAAAAAVAAATCTVWLPDRQSLIAGQGLRLSQYAVCSGARSASFTGLNCPVTSVSIRPPSADQHMSALVAATCANGEVLIWVMPPPATNNKDSASDAISQADALAPEIEPALHIYSDTNKHWIAWTKHGLYAESAEPGMAHLRPIAAGALESFPPTIYSRPDVLRLMLRSEDELSALITVLARSPAPVLAEKKDESAKSTNAGEH